MKQHIYVHPETMEHFIVTINREWVEDLSLAGGDGHWKTSTVLTFELKPGLVVNFPYGEHFLDLSNLLYIGDL